MLLPHKKICQIIATLHRVGQAVFLVYHPKHKNPTSIDYPPPLEPTQGKPLRAFPGALPLSYQGTRIGVKIKINKMSQ